MNLKNIPLRYLLPIALLASALVTSVAIYAYRMGTIQSELDDFVKRYVLEKRHLRYDLEYALILKNKTSLQYIITDLGSEEDLTAGLVVDEKDVVLASTRQAEIGSIFKNPQVFAQATDRDEPHYVIENDNLYVRYPFSMSPNAAELRSNRIGYLHIQLDLRRVKASLKRDIEFQMLLFGGSISVVAVLVWIYFRLVIQRRTNLLKVTAIKIGEGDFSARVKLGSGDEFGEIAQCINQMAGQIEIHQEQLRALRTALDKHAIVSIADVSGNIIYVNDQFCEISEYTREELLGKNHRIVKSSAHNSQFYIDLWQSISNGKVWQGVIENRRKSGKPYWVQSTIVPILDSDNLPAQYISVRTDVTIRERLRQAMEQLATATVGRDSFNEIAHAVAVGLECRWVGFGRLVNNGNELSMLGLWSNENDALAFSPPIPGSPCFDVINRKSAIIITDNFAKHYPEDKKLIDLGARCYRGEPLMNNDGSVYGVLFAIDTNPCREDQAERALMRMAAKRAILEVKRAEFEETLRENQFALAEGQRMAHLGSWTLKHSTQELHWSDEVFRIFEIDKEVFGASYEAFLNAIHPDDKAMVDSAYQESVNAKKPYSYTHRLLMPDGRVKWVFESGETSYDDAGLPIKSIGFVHDVTEQKVGEIERDDLQRKLQQAQKMEAIGLLTGGVAHDFNNMLAAIIGYTELAVTRFARNDEKLKEYLEQVLHAGRRGRDLVKQMLAFGRNEVGELQSVSPGSVVKEVTKLLSSTLPSSIYVNVHIDDAELNVAADPVQLHQSVMNLAINARDAVTEHGKITISVEKAQRVNTVCSSCHRMIEGTYIPIKVSDNGHGIDQTKINRIFEPFFTTKQVGKGSGMGLSMVHGILHQSGGHILVNSVVGEGTEFTLLLRPALPNLVTSETAVSNLSLSSTGSSKRVMVVDDEAGVSGFIAELLNVSGYQSRVFNNPVDALAAFKSAPNDYDLVITDQTMPNLTGAELCKQMLAIRRQVPIIICTGYSETLDEARATAIGVSAYLHKPVDTLALLENVSTLLYN